MRSVPRQQVQAEPRQYGFEEHGRGNGTALSEWRDSAGVRCQPKLCRRDVHISDLFRLGNELEAKGGVSRRRFMQALRQRSVSRLAAESMASPRP